MNDAHLDEALLNDAADGTLAGGAADAARAHLDACVRCSERVRELRALLEDARRLSAPIEPERDLWAGIQARMRARANEIRFPAPRRAEPSRRAAAWPPALRAAAALALLLTGGAAGVLIARAAQTPATGVAPSAGGGEAVLVADDGIPDLRAQVADGYASPIAELAAELDRRRADLPPEAVAEIERNLAIVDRAIEAARAAFDESPGDPVLPQMLQRAYGRKVELLERAVGLPRTL